MYQYLIYEPTIAALTLALLLLLAAGITSLYTYYKERNRPHVWRSDAEEVIRDSGYLPQQGNIYWTPGNRVVYEASRAEALAREKRKKKSSY